jgi:hypothetical protein
MATFEAMCKDGNVVPDVPAYNAAVAVLCRGGEMAAAERMAEAAARLAKKQGAQGGEIGMRARIGKELAAHLGCGLGYNRGWVGLSDQGSGGAVLFLCI